MYTFPMLLVLSINMLSGAPTVRRRERRDEEGRGEDGERRGEKRREDEERIKEK